MPNASQTEPGTPRHREQAREKGQIARSRDLPGAAAILAALGGMTWLTHNALRQWRAQFGALLEQATRPGATLGVEQLRSTFAVALHWSAPVVGVAWLAGTAVSLHGGFVFSMPALFNFERLQPGRNLKNIFSASGLSRILRSLLPASFIVYFTWSALTANWEPIMRAATLSPGQGMTQLGGLLLGLAWKFAVVLLCWSAVDYALQRRNHETSLRMSKQEIKDENKQTVGNPEIKGRIKRMQRQLRRRRMMLDVPRATVVITNPTQFAIALRYDPEEMAAPVVLAKGRGLIAQAIRALAVWNGIPVVENVSLARALYRHVEIGDPIPGNFYAAVAEILAFIFRAQARRPARAAAAPAPSSGQKTRIR